MTESNKIKDYWKPYIDRLKGIKCLRQDEYPYRFRYRDTEYYYYLRDGANNPMFVWIDFGKKVTRVPVEVVLYSAEPEDYLELIFNLDVF